MRSLTFYLGMVAVQVRHRQQVSGTVVPGTVALRVGAELAKVLCAAVWTLGFLLEVDPSAKYYRNLKIFFFFWMYLKFVIEIILK